MALGDEVGQPLPVSAAATQVFVRARAEHADKDFSAIMEAIRPHPAQQ